MGTTVSVWFLLVGDYAVYRRDLQIQCPEM